MSRILHQNSKGVTIVREDFRLRSQVKVYSGFPENKYCIRTYRFDFIHEPIEIPYCSWANLDCCGGWACDEEYLDTAVQKGLILFAGRVVSLRHQYNPNLPTRQEAERSFEMFQKTMPAGMFAGVERPQKNPNYFYTFICRTGKISDYIDLDTVFAIYGKLGQTIPASVRGEVQRFCEYEMKLYGTDQAPFQYVHAETAAELITTGLLLGYPVESTVSILQGY